MNTLQLWDIARQAAAELVRARRESAVVELYAFDVGGGSSNVSNKFARTGTSATDRSYNLPADLSALIKQAYSTSPVPSGLAENESQLLSMLLSRASESIPGVAVLQAIQQLATTDYNGRSALDTIIARNPYSTDYEQGTEALFNRIYDQARARAQSGPTNVRGGTARQAFELADLDTQMGLNRFREVRDQQNREAGTVTNAVNVANSIESGRRGQQLQAQGQEMQSETQRASTALGASDATSRLRAVNTGNLQLASEFLGNPKQTTTDNLAGRGTQISNTSSWGSGLSCCWTFMAYYGETELPAFVRAGRDDLVNPRRRLGYRWMSRWLVPRLHNRFIRFITKWTLIRPFEECGKQAYGEGADNPVWFFLLPVCFAWLTAWHIAGCFMKED